MNDPKPSSSRQRSRDTGVFTRDSSANRSLARGLSILRTYRPGIVALTNAEIAQRTGLPRPTVTRLTRTLVESGFLEYDLDSSMYRLGPPVLTLGQIAREGSALLRNAFPLMQEVAADRPINISLVTVDDDEVIYIETLRNSRLGVFRQLGPGSRLPMAETSLGHAWLGGISAPLRQPIIERLALRYGSDWSKVENGMQQSFTEIDRRGWCSVSWTDGLISMASPLVAPGMKPHAFGISFAAWTKDERKAGELAWAPLLLETLSRILAALAAERRMAE